MYTRLWRWLFTHTTISEPADIRRQAVYDYIDQRLKEGVSARTVNQDLRAFQATLACLQEQEYVIPQAVRRMPGLREPDALPRFPGGTVWKSDNSTLSCRGSLWTLQTCY